MTTDPYIQSVRTLWASGSYRDITVKCLSDMAGSSTIVLYRKYGSKRNLFLQVVKGIQDELVDLAVSAATDHTVHRRLNQAMLALIRAFEANPLYRNAYRDYPILASEQDCLAWSDVLAAVFMKVGLEKTAPQPVLIFYCEWLKSLYSIIADGKKRNQTEHALAIQENASKMMINYLAGKLMEITHTI